MTGHQTFIIAKLGAQYQARCHCGWHTVWLVTEGSHHLAEAAADEHERDAT